MTRYPLYGLGCFKCSNVADPGQCTTTGQCAGDELCFIEKKLSGGLSEYYNMGCEKQQVCDAIGGSDVIIGKKRNVKTRPSADRTKRDVTLCNKCCNTDSCNLMICTDIGNIPASSDIYVRLVGGSNAYEGTVEVFFNGRWGSICDDHWTNNDAQVVCIMLGYQGNGAQAIGGGAFVPGQNSIWLTNVTCTGSEPSLYQCQHDQWGVTQCLHNQDAGITCSSVTPEDDVIFLLDTGFGGMIFRMNLRTMSFTPIPLSQLYSPESFDYDPSLGRIYFVDSRLLQIISMKFDGTDVRVVRQLDINSRVDKIQVDPLNRLIFFTDDGNNVIFSMNMDGSNLTQVVSSNLDNPRGIVLDPRSKTVYWSDWGAQAKIESANYDGSNRKTLVDTNIKWPNGLAVDYNAHLNSIQTVANKLYFVDGSLGTIETITLQGTSRREIFKDAGAHLFSIDVFDDYLYYTDWNRDTLMRIRKDGSGQTVVGPPSFRELSDVRVHKYGTDLAGVTTPSPVHFDPSHVFVRMGGQGDATSGRIEIFANSQWGTICDDHWDDNDAKVVCHMMGFSKAYAKATGQSSQGNGFGLISLDEVNCTGTENHIVDCGSGHRTGRSMTAPTRTTHGVNCEPPEALNFLKCWSLTYTSIVPNDSPNAVAITFDPNDKMMYFSEVYASSSEIRSSNHRGTYIRTIGNTVIMGKVSTIEWCIGVFCFLFIASYARFQILLTIWKCGGFVDEAQHLCVSKFGIALSDTVQFDLKEIKFYMNELNVSFQKTLCTACDLDRMVSGHWSLRSYRDKELEKVEVVIRRQRNYYKIPTGLERNDSKCGNLSYEDLDLFRAVCNPNGDTPCCYNNKCVNKTVAQCQCEDSYDFRRNIYAELADWTPNDPMCELLQFKTKEDVCDVVRNATIFFVGESYLRQIYVSLLAVFEENDSSNVFEPKTSPAIIQKCDKRYRYTADCRQSISHSLIECDNSTRFHCVELYEVSRVQTVIDTLKAISGKMNSWFIFGFGHFDNYDANLVLKKLLEPVLAEAAKSEWPKLIWHEPHAADILKTPKFSKQLNSFRLNFSIEVKDFLKKHNIPLMSFFTMTKTVVSYDGSHYGKGVNDIKLQDFLPSHKERANSYPATKKGPAITQPQEKGQLLPSFKDRAHSYPATMKGPTLTQPQGKGQLLPSHKERANSYPATRKGPTLTQPQGKGQLLPSHKERANSYPATRKGPTLTQPQRKGQHLPSHKERANSYPATKKGPTLTQPKGKGQLYIQEGPWGKKCSQLFGSLNKK
ncbi:hypothetical protein Btru_050159 [Bulinus truncatus]|nr:hypothetical protein Btru_050159 [Bulinus truncatus]